MINAMPPQQLVNELRICIDPQLHEGLGYHTPAEVKAAYYADLESTQPALAGQGTK